VSQCTQAKKTSIPAFSSTEEDPYFLTYSVASCRNMQVSHKQTAPAPPRKSCSMQLIASTARNLSPYLQGDLSFVSVIKLPEEGVLTRVGGYLLLTCSRYGDGRSHDVLGWQVCTRESREWHCSGGQSGQTQKSQSKLRVIGELSLCRTDRPSLVRSCLTWITR